MTSTVFTPCTLDIIDDTPENPPLVDEWPSFPEGIVLILKIVIITHFGTVSAPKLLRDPAVSSITSKLVL